MNKTNTFKKRRCRECGEGTIQLLAKTGRFVRHKTMQALEIPADLKLPTCNACGATWYTHEDTRRLTAAMEKVYREKLRLRAQKLMKILSGSVQKNELERLLGLSHGYLSHLSSGKRDPSPTLVGQLAILALDAERRVAELRHFWNRANAKATAPRGHRRQRQRLTCD